MPQYGSFDEKVYIACQFVRVDDFESGGGASSDYNLREHEFYIIDAIESAF